MHRVLTFFLLLLIIKNGVLSQTDSIGSQSLSGVVGLGVISASEDFMPFYLVNNQWGEVSNDQTTFISGQLSYKYAFSKDFLLSTGFSFRNEVLSSHFVSLNYDFLKLSIGRFKNSIGGLEKSLSSGSLGVSENSRPIPLIQLEIPEYIEVPFTRGYFKTKGHLAHGWLEEDRYISNALLHSKSFYLMLDLEDEIGWTAASGVVHFAQYGGTSPQGDRQPSSFSDFLRVFAGSGIPNPDGTTEGESNGVGNHLGIIETTVTQRIGEHKLTINYQKPFEDRGGLQYVSLTDYLFGLEWSLPKKNAIVNTLYLEYIQTKWQGGPGLPDPASGVLTVAENFGYSFGGRDDIYNNWLYRSGWTYKERVIGNPLFLTHEHTLNFFQPYPDHGVAIANNRLRAIHLGLRGKISSKVNYEGLFTYTQNLGTYAGLYEGRFAWNGVIQDQNFDYVFRPIKEQFYTYLTIVGENFFEELPVSFEIRIAYDFGDLYESFGSEISVNYNLTKD